MKMMDALPSYQSQGFKTWLSRIAFNTAIDSYRKKKRRKEELTTFEDRSEIFKPNESAEKVMLTKERLANIHHAIRNMPETFREVVYRYYIQEKSYMDIARELNLAEKTVEMRLYRARKWMRENWKEEEL